MKKLLWIMGLVLLFAFGGLRLLPGEAETVAAEHLRPLSASETLVWERRLRAYQRAKARIQLNDRLDNSARQQAIEQLQIDYFGAPERERLRQHEDQRDRQQQALDL